MMCSTHETFSTTSNREFRRALSADQFGGSIGGPIIPKNFLLCLVRGISTPLRTQLCRSRSESQPRSAGALIPGTSTLVNPAISPICCLPIAERDHACRISDRGFDVVQLQDTAKVNEDAYAARFDYNPNSKNNLYFRWFRDNGSDVSPEGVSGRIVRIEAQRKTVSSDGSTS